MMEPSAREAIESDAVFHVGHVSAVRGRRVHVRVDKEKNGSHLFYRGELIRNVGVGSYVKVTKGFVEMVGKVDGESIQEDRAASERYGRASDRIARTLEVSLVGFLEDGAFQRGVRELPLLDNECFVLREHELLAVHDLSAGNDSRLQIGVLATDPTQPVSIDVDKFFGSHIGIFGNTGSGKSYTLAKLYYELFQAHSEDAEFGSGARFVLLDFNGEYVDRDGAAGDPSTRVITTSEFKTAYRLTTRDDHGDRLPMSEEALRDPTFWTVLLNATERTQAPFIRRVVDSNHWKEVMTDNNRILGALADLVWRATRTTVQGMDRQTATTILRDVDDCLGDESTADLAELIDKFATHLQLHGVQNTFFWDESDPWRWANTDDWEGFIKAKVKALSIDIKSSDAMAKIRLSIVFQYYTEIVNGHSNREHLSPLIKRLDSRVDDIRRVVKLSEDNLTPTPLTVISLRGVNLDMRKIIPMLLCKQLYEAKKSEPPGGYLNLIVDEAHNILSTQSTRESDAWRDHRLETFEEIIKEGRKFGVFLTLASQRPHDISETIISQLHNYFLHRLINEMDIKAIERAVAYLDAVSFESLPILATGTCVVAGVSTQVPVVVQIGGLPEAAVPDSRTMSVITAWRGAGDEDSDADDGDPT